MVHLPHLISDLGVILVTAAVVTLLFRKLKQPVVLGYIIAGYLVGPGIPFLPTVKEPESIKVWAEIGVIFLLFGLGLEFSFKKLARVGKSASITALFEVIAMVGIGFLTGVALGWSRMDSLFLGGILSISSTTIIVRAFEELGLKGQRFVSLVFGVLIVEDLVAILLLVLLSTVAVTQTLSGTELLGSTLKLGFFLLLWFIVGIYVLPAFLSRVRAQLTDETALVVALGLCLLMVMIATNVGFSPALGAFVMGSLLAETRDAKRIEHLLMPVRDLFAAVFFVSVGMLLDTKILFEYGPEIVLISVVTILGKLLSSSLGAFVSGRSLRDSIKAGFSLAQIGEFSFIIATLGLTLKVTSDFLYPIAVAVSALTTFTTPYLIKWSDPIATWVEQKLPDGTRALIHRYESAASQEVAQKQLGAIVWKAFGSRVLINTILTIAVGLALDVYVRPIAIEMLGETSWTSTILSAAGIVLAAPFLWAVVYGGSAASLTTEEASRIQRLTPGFLVARALVAFLLVTFLINIFEPGLSFLGAIAAVVTIALFFGTRYAGPIYHRMESRFVSNLTDKDDKTPSPHRPVLTPWDATLSEMVVSPNSEVVGQTLLSSKIKDRFGVMISLIERGTKRILAPTRDHILMPYDRLFVIGHDSQIAEARKTIEEDIRLVEGPVPASFGLTSLIVSRSSENLARYIGKSLRDCGLREDVEGIVVGIERSGTRTLNPDSNWILHDGDLVWLVADIKKVRSLNSDQFVPGVSIAPT